MCGPTVSISEIVRQTLIACAALLACVVSAMMTAKYFAQIDPEASQGVMIAVGIVMEIAKVGFALTGAHYWHQGCWTKSGLFWFLSSILSACSVIAAHGVVTASDAQGVTKRIEASAEYGALSHEATVQKAQLESLVAVMKKDDARDRDTRALETERRIERVQEKYIETQKKLAAQRAGASVSAESRGTSSSWRWLVTIMIEIIGQVAMIEWAAIGRRGPQHRIVSTSLPDSGAPSPDDRRLQLVPKINAPSSYREAERLVREGLPATHEALMTALCCSRSTVQRILKRMRLEGVTRLDGNRNVLAA